MPFDTEVLLKYTKNNPDSHLNRFIHELLVEKINEYCRNCENERMTCVLSPACFQRFLLDLRIGGYVEKGYIPSFCYQQSLLNFKKYLEKKTNLYKPRDSYFYLSDVIPLIFPGIEKQVYANLKERNYKQLHEIIKKSKVPGIWLKKNGKEILEKIISNDKLIKEGTFLYEGEDRFLVIWREGDLFVIDMNYEFVIVNVTDLYLFNLNLLKNLLQMIFSENLLNYEISIDNSEIIKAKVMIPNVSEHQLEKSLDTNTDKKSPDEQRAISAFENLISNFEAITTTFSFDYLETNEIIITFTFITNRTYRTRVNLPMLTPYLLRKAVGKIPAFFNIQSKNL
jgi:hypothetical protein